MEFDIGVARWSPLVGLFPLLLWTPNRVAPMASTQVISLLANLPYDGMEVSDARALDL